MSRGKELIGLPIIDESSGEHIAEIVQLVVDFEVNKLKGFLVSHHVEEDFLPIENVLSIGRDAILIKTTDKNNHIAEANAKVNLVPQQITGISVLSKKGDSLGRLDDVLIDCQNKIIAGFEISDGLIKDVFQGRTKINLDQIVSYNNGTLIVDLENGLL